MKETEGMSHGERYAYSGMGHESLHGGPALGNYLAPSWVGGGRRQPVLLESQGYRSVGKKRRRRTKDFMCKKIVKSNR